MQLYSLAILTLTGSSHEVMAILTVAEFGHYTSPRCLIHSTTVEVREMEAKMDVNDLGS